jgi:anti-sigma-K factor RskA
MNMDEYPTIDGCDGNAAPYVLGALTDDEVTDFLTHMESCSICRDEVAALRVVSAALPGAAPQLRAPAELRARVMATVNQEAGLRRTTEPSRRVRRPTAWRFSWRPMLALGTAAAAVIAVAVIALQPSGSGGGGSRVISAHVTPANATAFVSLSGTHAELNIKDLPATEPNRVYEVWVKRSGAPQPTKALFTVTAAGDATVGVPGSVAGVKEVLVTSEPRGGSRVPTRAPVIVARLS